jgi:4-amino-4-deoxy-L-arabinose transferase
MNRATTPALLLTFLGTAAFFFTGLGSVGLVEPSDARYAEIAHEMWESGDFLFPRLLGIPHFHKPPLMYWISCAGRAVFGANEWGARIGLGVLGLLLVGMIHRFSRRHLGPDVAPWSVLLVATTPAVIGASRGLSTDLLLATGQTLVLTNWYDIVSGQGGRCSKLGFYLGLGLVVLTKGPVGLLVVLVIIIVFSWLRRGMNARLVRWRIVPGLCLVLAVGLPWYLYVVTRTPGLLGYFLGEQLGSRLVEGGQGHPHSFLYYLYVFPALGLPWLLFAPAGFRRLRRDSAGLATFLLVWALTPPLLFSVPASKLPLYVLIAYPAMAMLAAKGLAAPANPRRLVRTLGGLFVLLGLGLAGICLVDTPLSSGDLEGMSGRGSALLLLPVAGMTLAAGIFAVVRTRPGSTDCRAAVLALVLSLGLVPAWASSQGDALPLKSVRGVGRAVAEEFREGDLVVEYRDLTGALPFYSGHLPLLAAMERETRFGGGDRVASLEEFQALWKGPRRLLVVTRTKHADDLVDARMLHTATGYSLLTNR